MKTQKVYILAMKTIADKALCDEAVKAENIEIIEGTSTERDKRRSDAFISCL